METLILFDLGGVLVELDFASVYMEWGRLAKKDPAEVMRSYANSGLEDRMNHGTLVAGTVPSAQALSEVELASTPSSNAYCDGMRQKVLGTDTDNLRIISALCRSIKVPINDMILLKERLRARHQVGVLSTIGEINHHNCLARCPTVFNVSKPELLMLSYKEHVAKPDIRAYARVGRGDHIIYIDDKPNYLKPPLERLGWRCIHFAAYIDEAEANRQTERPQVTLASPCFRRADSYEQLTMILNEWGIATRVGKK